MELIYANHERLALGQLSSFDIDFDATGDKNFELTIDEFILRKGYWIFIPDTEIGGIIDSVTVNTEANSVQYIGRNFRGVLNDKVLTVPRGQTYISVQGEIDDVINELIDDAGLSKIFVCLAPDTDDVDGYVDFALEPFCTLYDGIMGIAASINFKLLFSYNAATNKVELTPMLVEDFTDFLTYTKNSSVNLELQDNAMAVNHFVLVGYGENSARYQIDLFVNENAQIMDFATVLAPIKDSQYILDNRNQQFFGIDERVQVDISDSVSPIENYEYLSSKPSDWSKNYRAYFYQKLSDETADGSEVSYENFAPVLKYRKLSAQPSDWAENYASYFEKDGEGNYKNIDGVVTETESYKKVKKKPKGWKETYKDYFYRTTDGLTYTYSSIGGLSKSYYKKQKYKPTDWESNWNSYYQVVKVDGKTKYDTAGAYYRDSKSKSKKDQGKKVRETSKNAPKWQKYKFYTKVTKTYAPKFTAADVYAKKVTQSAEQAPAFVANAVYQQYETAPHFSGCYRMVYDHYGGMIAKLLESLEVFPVNKQEVSLADFDADIGDVVGGYDSKTGITLTAPILNIIYRIERGIQRSIEYVLGG